MGQLPRVLHVLEALEGGTARHLIDLVGHAEGFEHHVVVPPARLGRPTAVGAPAKMAAAGATVQNIAMARTPIHPSNVAAVVRLRALIRRLAPAIVHGHSSVGGALARLAAAGTPARTVYTPNAVSAGSLARRVERVLARRTGRIIAVSPSERDLLLELGIGHAGGIAVIPNGIDIDEVPAPIDLRARLGIDAEALLVGNVSRLVDQKDPLTFVRACALVGAARPDVSFVLIGSGPLRGAVVDEIAQRGLIGRLHLVEDLLEDSAGALGQLELVALTSRFEGGPYVPLEAMRAGVPVIATDVVGMRDAIEDGVTGLLFAPGDPAGLAERIVALLAGPEERRAMAEAGLRRLRQRFDIRQTARATGDLYRELLS